MRLPPLRDRLARAWCALRHSWTWEVSYGAERPDVVSFRLFCTKCGTTFFDQVFKAPTP